MFEGNTTNKDIYDSLGERVVQSVMKGFNATIFMYGQTGSGKTHTMIGKKTDPGLVQLISNNVFLLLRGFSKFGSFIFLKNVNQKCYELHFLVHLISDM